MQEEMNELFIPRMNRFIELFSNASKMHAEHVRRLQYWQRELNKENKQMIGELQHGMSEAHMADEKSIYEKMQDYLAYCNDFEEYAKSLRGIFQEYINDCNHGLGTLGNHWGRYVELLGVQYMLHKLRKYCGIHTSYQKFERVWEDKEQVEIDLLAVSDTHVYVVEVKSHLKEDTFIQMLYILDKIRNKIPEYSHLKIQPVFVCTYADEDIIHTTTLSGLWIVRYNNFNPDRPQKNFEWLRKDVEQAL